MTDTGRRAGSVAIGIAGGLSFSVLAGILVAALVTPLVSVAGATVNNSVGIFDSLPEAIAIDQQPQQNRVFANDNGVSVQIATMFDQNREEVSWDEVSDFAKNAAVSGEDRRFYNHGGVDPAGIARAAVANVAAGGIAEGASTITQQYVKNTFVQAALELPEAEQAAAYDAAIDTSFSRKLQEMKFAISLEKQYTKEEILLAYLNIANFGGTTYGIEAASQRYYNTTALNLTAAQAASLIAIVQSPTALRLDNSENWQRNTERRDVILDAMLSDSNITPEQHAEAIAVVADETTVTLTEPSNGCRVANNYTRYFCDYITNLIPELESLGADPTERAANWRHGGYDVYTTLEMGLQTTAQDAVWANAPNDTTRLELGAAAVSVEVGTGRILTMAQNKTYDNTGDADPTTTAVNFNTDRAYGGSSGFQPGSTYKVFTLLNWLENGKSINATVNGSPRTIPQNQFTNSCDPSQVIGAPYEFGNDDGFGGTMSVATGVQRSVNGAFMSMALELDLCEIKETAESIGVHRADGGELGMTPASVLGTNEIAPLTMATAYAAIANQGVYCTSVAVDRIVGPDGAELPGQPRNCSDQLGADVANTAAYAMAAVMVGGGTATRSNPNNGVEYIGKTGTTDSSNQTWIVGASTRVATAVWVGNIEGEYAMRSYRNNAGVQGGVIRHDIFRPIAAAIDRTPNYRGSAFPDPAVSLTTTPRAAVAPVTPRSTTPTTPTTPGTTAPTTPAAPTAPTPPQNEQAPAPTVPETVTPD
jgi:membrane peptidoglycan carboxypeptidase